LHPQKVMEITEVFHRKLSGKKIYDVVQKRGRAACEDNVIHIQEQNEKSNGMTYNKHREVNTTTSKAQGNKEVVELMELGSRSLVQSIK